MSYFREKEPRVPSRNPLTDVQACIRDEYGDHPRPFCKRFSVIPPLKVLSQKEQEDIYKKALERERELAKRFVEAIASDLQKPILSDDEDSL